MPIPLDLANLASSHVENDVGTLDLANLNSSGHNDAQAPEEPVVPSVEQVIGKT